MQLKLAIFTASLALFIIPFASHAVGLGGTCTSVAAKAECDTGLFCGLDASNNKVCVAGKAIGDTCTDNYACVSNACDSATKTCKLGSGQPCAETTECATGLICDLLGANPSYKCKTPPKLGQPCTVVGSKSECADGLFCDYDNTSGKPVCVDAATNGTACAKDFECQSGYCNTETGKCDVNAASSGGTTGSSPTGGTTDSSSTGAPPSYELPNPIGETSLNKLMGRIIRYIIGISGTAAFLVFVYGGIMLLISRGESAFIKKGKHAMIMAVAGLALIFSSYILIKFIINLMYGQAF
jgi:hypothetical protein